MFVRWCSVRFLLAPVLYQQNSYFFVFFVVFLFFARITSINNSGPPRLVYAGSMCDRPMHWHYLWRVPALFRTLASLVGHVCAPSAATGIVLGTGNCRGTTPTVTTAAADATSTSCFVCCFKTCYSSYLAGVVLWSTSIKVHSGSK